MWNYNFVLPNIIILVTFFLFYKLQPHLSISRNRSFMRLVLLEIALIVVDIISSQCLDNYTAYPLLFLKAINILYFVLFLFRCTFFFHFTVLLFTHRAKQKKKLMFLVYLVFWLCFMVVIANFFTPTIFKIDNLGYHKGALYNSIYICAFFYCILAIVLLVSYRTRFNKISVVYAIIFNVILLAGYVIRLCFPRYLIMDFFCLLSILVIYLSFENSSHYMDAKSGAFNLDALSLFLEEDKYRRSVILGIIIQDYDDMREIAFLRFLARTPLVVRCSREIYLEEPFSFLLCDDVQSFLPFHFLYLAIPFQFVNMVSLVINHHDVLQTCQILQF